MLKEHCKQSMNLSPISERLSVRMTGGALASVLEQVLA